MAWRERKVAENGPDGEPAKSAGFRKNPRKHAGTVAIRRKKAPTENSWGFNNGGLGSIESCLGTRINAMFSCPFTAFASPFVPPVQLEYPCA